MRQIKFNDVCGLTGRINTLIVFYSLATGLVTEVACFGHRGWLRAVPLNQDPITFRPDAGASVGIALPCLGRIPDMLDSCREIVPEFGGSAVVSRKTSRANLDLPLFVRSPPSLSSSSGPGPSMFLQPLARLPQRLYLGPVHTASVAVNTRSSKGHETTEETQVPSKVGLMSYLETLISTP